MIIGSDSPLRRLPANLDLKQRLYFDGIRYSIEMADLAHMRLKQTLYDLTINREKLAGLHYRHFVPAVLDTWSIIDSVHRLRGLIQQTPGFKQKSPGLKIFSQETSIVEELRNSVQHLNHTIEVLVRESLPVWGVISWVFVKDENEQSALCCTLVPGTMFDRKPDMIVNPLGKSIDFPIGLITLVANGYTVGISEIMEHVQKLTIKVEAQIKEQFVDLPPAGADMLAFLELQFDDKLEVKPDNF